MVYTYSMTLSIALCKGSAAILKVEYKI